MLEKSEKVHQKHRVEIIASWFNEKLDNGIIPDSEVRAKLTELVWPNDRNKGHQTLLHLLARIRKKGVGRVIDIAINEFGLRVNAGDNLHNTPAHVALAAENEEAFVALRINKANLKIKNRMDETPEELAGNNQKSAMVELARTEPALELVQLVRPKPAKV